MNRCATNDAAVAPRWTTGPSRPALAPGDYELKEQADNQAACGGGEKDVPPRQVVGQGGDLLSREAIEDFLCQAQQQAKPDRAVPNRHADDQCERREHDLIVGGEASPPSRHGVETWQLRRHRPTFAFASAPVMRRLSNYYWIDCISRLHSVGQGIVFK
ncbi:MAG: hypothetical protein OXC14_01660 [Rhodospirillaceae bacterium]|nr:hypothetical protein [Rhodospirillaceae bacterium]